MGVDGCFFAVEPNPRVSFAVAFQRITELQRATLHANGFQLYRKSRPFERRGKYRAEFGTVPVVPIIE